jgi:hypothetical protein
MNPTFFHLLFLFVAPLVWFSGNKRARLLILLAIPLVVTVDVGLAMGSLAGFAAAICLDYRHIFRLSSNSCIPAIVAYSALCTIPNWMPAAWRFWPGHLLANEAWAPAYGGNLYEKFGSQQALPSVDFWQPLVGCLALAILLFAYSRIVAIIGVTSNIEDN